AAKQSIVQHVRKHGLLRCARNDAERARVISNTCRNGVLNFVGGDIAPTLRSMTATDIAP
ncbi:MAG: hypothetical protein ABW175_02160, partial [Bradyrhizobium sp.]